MSELNLFQKGVKYFRLRFLFMGGKIRSLYTPEQYGIKKGYRHRHESIYFDDRELTDEYQNEVYQMARSYADQFSYKTILDLGCGSAFKLLKFFSGFSTAGIEVNPTYDFLKEKYPGRTWINADEPATFPSEADIIICADVVEHVRDPDELLATIRKIRFKFLFLSTPERDLVRGRVDYGPPDNKAHVREWNQAEFHDYISRHFSIVAHTVINPEQGTQLIICSPSTTE